MAKITIDSFLYDVGELYASADAFVDDVISRTETAWDSGADIVLFPEYIWANLMWYSDPYLSPVQLADFFWGACWPKIKGALSRSDKMVVLGSVTFQCAEGLRNRAPMIVSGEVFFQDKICLTPWESHLDGGDEIRIFEFKGAKIVNLICLDSEIPATSDLLKQNGPIDIILVPSATESLVGVERIARCASARAVELGAAVIVSQLTGGVGDEYIGYNLGQCSLYLPSLFGTDSIKRIDERGIEKSGTMAERFEVDLELLKQAREDLQYTNPALIKAQKPVNVCKSREG